MYTETNTARPGQTAARTEVATASSRPMITAAQGKSKGSMRCAVAIAGRLALAWVAIFYVVDSGWGKLTLNESHLHHNPSGEFQTFPGIYDNIDGHDGPPVMIHSTDN
jgi:hypothetical protein